MPHSRDDDIAELIHRCLTDEYSPDDLREFNRRLEESPIAAERLLLTAFETEALDGELACLPSVQTVTEPTCTVQDTPATVAQFVVDSFDAHALDSEPAAQPPPPRRDELRPAHVEQARFARKTAFYATIGACVAALFFVVYFGRGNSGGPGPGPNPAPSPSPAEVVWNFNVDTVEVVARGAEKPDTVKSGQAFTIQPNVKTSHAFGALFQIDVRGTNLLTTLSPDPNQPETLMGSLVSDTFFKQTGYEIFAVVISDKTAAVLNDKSAQSATPETDTPPGVIASPERTDTSYKSSLLLRSEYKELQALAAFGDGTGIQLVLRKALIRAGLSGSFEIHTRVVEHVNGGPPGQKLPLGGRLLAFPKGDEEPDGPVDEPLPPAVRKAYVALLVAVPKCADLDMKTLQYVVPSSARLAAQLKALKYDVTEMKGEEATPAAIKNWLTTHATKDKCDLALLAYGGHGVERAGVQYLLTSEATARTGGVSVSELDDLASRKEMPLTLILDCCRTDAGPAIPPRQKAMLPGAETNALKNALKGSDGKKGLNNCTSFYTAPRDTAVPDANRDLISILAEGLERNPDTKRFRATPLLSSLTHTPDENALSLRAWFTYAIVQSMLQAGLSLQAYVQPGRVPLETYMAQADPLGPPRLKMTPAEAGTDEDLLKHWRPKHGDLAAACEPRNGGSWVVRSAATGNLPFVGGFLAEMGDGFPIKEGMVVYAEFSASSSPLIEPPERFSIGVDLKYVDSANTNSFVSADGKASACELTYGKPFWRKFHLAPGKKLNYFAVTNPPKGTVLTLQHLVIGPDLPNDPRNRPTSATANISLFRRWWVGMVGFGSGTPSPHPAAELADGVRALRVSKGQGWVGGIVAPSEFVASEAVVTWDLENLENAPATVLLELKEGEGVLGSEIVTLKPRQQTTVNVRVERPGLLDYLAVNNPTGDIRIRSAELKPAK